MKPSKTKLLSFTYMSLQTFSFILVVLVLQLTSTIAIENRTDAFTLLRIKDELLGSSDNDVLSSWNVSLHHCTWEGITCERGSDRVSTLNLSSKGLQEYGLGSDASTGGDIYSYGILLLELMTGKKPTDSIFTDGLNLHLYVEAALPDEVLRILDQTLLGNDEVNVVEEIVASVMQVGVACSNHVPEDRMRITEVIRKLRVARDNLINAQRHRELYGGE